MLTSKQRAYLRGLGNPLDTILIKGKCLETSPLSSRDAAEEIASQIGAEVVQVIGTKFILYRRNEKKPVIVLPKK